MYVTADLLTALTAVCHDAMVDLKLWQVEIMAIQLKTGQKVLGLLSTSLT